MSLGGLMTLKLAQHYPLKHIAVMSAPKEKSDDGLIEHLVYYSQRMSNILNLDQQASSAQLAAIDDYEGEITKFQHFIDDIMTNLNVIKCQLIYYLVVKMHHPMKQVHTLFMNI